MVIGASAGGMTALGKLFSMLPGKFPLSVIAVQHLSITISWRKEMNIFLSPSMQG